MRDFILEIFKLIGELNYWHIGLLTALESTCIPIVIPVETVIIPMGYYAYLGVKSLPLLMFASTIGIVCGCVINYYFAMLLGRTFIYKNAKLLHINIERLKKIEKMFLRHGRLLMFVGRFVPIPAFKHIITIPAGMAKMPIGQFIFYNMLGGFIFSTSMLLIGYFFGSSEELIHKAIGKFTVACVIIFITYLAVRIVVTIISKRHRNEICDDIYAETIDTEDLKSKQKDNDLPYDMYRTNDDNNAEKKDSEKDKYKNLHTKIGKASFFEKIRRHRNKKHIYTTNSFDRSKGTKKSSRIKIFKRRK